MWTLVALYPWPADEAVKIAGCETGGTFDPTLVSKDGRQLGLFQVDYPSHAGRVGPDPAALFDPATNVAIAYQVWEASNGWRLPWAGCLHVLG